MWRRANPGKAQFQSSKGGQVGEGSERTRMRASPRLPVLGGARGGGGGGVEPGSVDLMIELLSVHMYLPSYAP